jgi:NADH-quinone oxidoreductase subunit A
LFFKIGIWTACCIFANASNPMRMDDFFLQVTAVNSGINTSYTYLPVGMQLLFAIGFVFVILGVTHLLGPSRRTDEKLQNFESGIEGVGNARQPMAIKYFLVAILFVLFDVEVIFFYPYAVNFRELGWAGFGAVLLFVGSFLAGFLYIIKKGALQWED